MIVVLHRRVSGQFRLYNNVYRFKEPADAQKFMKRFDGERFDPIERGRGENC